MTRFILSIIAIVFVNVASAQCWSSVSAGLTHSLGIRNDGTLWTWGRNDYGQLGDGTIVNRKVPVQIGTNTNWVVVDAGIHQSIAIKSDGTLWSWGRGNTGLAGNGQDQVANHFPVQVGTDTDWAFASIGYSHVLALKTDNSLWGWGSNNAGRIGICDCGGIVTVPTQIGTDTDWQMVDANYSSSVAIKNNGTMWGWGQYNNGSFNTGSLDNGSYCCPTLIQNDTDWLHVSKGEQTLLALRADGTLWACGSNYFGTVGNNGAMGTGQGEPSLVQLNNESWNSINISSTTSRAIRSDGTLWSWGHNSHGQIGDGTTVDRSVPTMIGTNTNWLSVTGGAAHTLALTTTHSLYAWGQNHYGQLGDNSTAHKSNPTAIGFPCSLSVDEQPKRELKIWPNPANEKVAIGIGTAIAEVTLEVYNVAGQKMNSRTISLVNGSYELPIAAYPQGVYFVTISTGEGLYRGKFIKL